MISPHIGTAGHALIPRPWLGIGFQVLTVLLFFIILWWLLKGNQKNQYTIQSDISAEEILKKRYALGEITKKQFLEMKKDIGAK